MLAGDKFICPVPHCSFARSSKPLVTTHFYQTHFKRFKCKKCGVKASSESRLAEHIENHLGVKGRTKDRIVCEVCSKSMTRTSFTRSGHQLNFSLFFVKCCCFSWRTNYRPLNGEEIILFFPSRNSRLRPLKGYKMTLCPSRARNSMMHSELQRYMDAVRCVARSSEFPWHC